MKRKANPPPTGSKTLILVGIAAAVLVVVGVVVLLVLSGDSDNPDAPGGPGALKGLPVGKWQTSQIAYELNADGTFRWQDAPIPDERLVHTGTVSYSAENRFLLTGTKDYFNHCHEYYPRGAELVVVAFGAKRKEKRPNESPRPYRCIFHRVGVPPPPPLPD